ncbi:MAG: type II toxin-antitoxin system mRNA interferase toxin, RelE/StbE family [Ignavibacteriae bacterium]|nr:type II toxin-antitoxin system mRNA interferase toxin, RelE/StbE family [Ignavibacteriota bacterium]
MIELRYEKSFERAFKQRKKRNEELKEKIYSTLDLLSTDVHHSKLGTHKLKGDLKDLWACSIDYYYRIVFTFHQDPRTNKEVILLVDIGTHDEVY